MFTNATTTTTIKLSKAILRRLRSVAHSLASLQRFRRRHIHGGKSFSRMIWCLSNEYSTVTSVFATATIVTGQEVATIAAGGTVTVTETADASATVQKRDAQITAAPHADLYRHLLARQNSNFTSPAANSSVASALSSACSCLNIPASETTLTFTTDAVVSSTHYGHMSIN